jgi:hypothetical protein
MSEPPLFDSPSSAHGKVVGPEKPASVHVVDFSFMANFRVVPPIRRLSHMGLFRRSRYGLGGSDTESSKCVLPQEVDCRDGVEGNGHPHIAQLRKLQGNMNVLKPKGGTLGG